MVLTITKALTKTTNYDRRAKKWRGTTPNFYPVLRTGSVPPLLLRTGSPTFKFVPAPLKKCQTPSKTQTDGRTFVRLSLCSLCLSGASILWGGGRTAMLRGLFMSLVIHYLIGDVQDCQGVSDSEMTYSVSSGAMLHRNSMGRDENLGSTNKYTKFGQLIIRKIR